MEAVEKNISNEKIKNKYLVSGFWGSFKEKITPEQRQKIKEFFFENCNDENYTHEAEHALEQFNKLQKGDTLPELLTLNVDGKEVKLKSLIKNKDAVIYFWPKDPGRKEVLLKILPYFKKKYPDVAFIGIGRDSDQEDWKKFITGSHLETKEQLNLDKKCKLYSWFDGDMARTLVIDKKGIIQEPFIFFTDTYTLDMNLHQLKKQ